MEISLYTICNFARIQSHLSIVAMQKREVAPFIIATSLRCLAIYPHGPTNSLFTKNKYSGGTSSR